MVGDSIMSIALFQEVNNLIAEATFEASEQETLSLIGMDGYPTAETITEIQKRLLNNIQANREKRLKQAKDDFARDKAGIAEKIMRRASTLTVDNMLSDIVKAIQNTEKVPEGILLAFREQSKNKENSEKDILEIWDSLARLGLIEDEDSK